MKLRMRLAVTTIGVMVPMVVGLVWLDGRARHRAAEAALANAATWQLLQSGERERCEAAPATWGKARRPPGGPPPADGPRRPPPADEARGQPPPSDNSDNYPPPPRRPRGGAPPVYYAFDDTLHSSNPAAPAIPVAVAAAIADRDVATIPTSSWGEEILILVRTPWRTGPCALVVARGTTTPGWLGALLPASPIWLAPSIGILVAVLLAVGPIVGRLRRLTQAVQRSAADGFAGAIRIEGRDEIGDLARAFDAAGREVQTQLAAKDQRERALRDFLANTTHDVMIPLTVLQAHLTTLQERLAAGEAIDPAIVTSAMDEAHYLGSLMHNLAVAAKLDAGEPQLLRGPVDLDALVTRVLGRHRPIARQLGVALEHALPERGLATDADVTLLEQAVSNIVYNAIRHNRSGGHVAVILESRSPDQFRLQVLDDGPGIPAAELSRLVERGFRGSEARTRAPDGQGLGLHIACQVAELHGLRLAFQASEYGGLQVDLEGPTCAGGTTREPAG